jgi:serine/threonine protein kinase
MKNIGRKLASNNLESHHLRNTTLQFIVSEIVNALDYMHKIGIVHRDLKPENIFINESGHIKIGDLGSAGISEIARRLLKIKSYKHKDGEKEEGKLKTFVGTKEYVSPEILKASGCSPAADMWSLGVIIYQLFTGYTPFNVVESEYLTFQNIIEAKYDLPDCISEVGKDLIKKLLILDPKERLTAEQVRNHEFFADFELEKYENKDSPLCALYDQLNEKEVDLISSDMDSFTNGENFDEDFSDSNPSMKQVYLTQRKESNAVSSNAAYKVYLKKSSSLGERDIKELDPITDEEKDEGKKEEQPEAGTRQTAKSHNTNESKDNSREITYDSIVEPCTPTLRALSPDFRYASAKDIQQNEKVVVLEGFIKKSTAWILTKIYRRRYMELSYNGDLPRLVYYTASRKMLRNEIPLTKHTKVYATGKGKFEIADLGNTYYFRDCGGEAKVKQWVYAISNAISQINNRKTSFKGNKALSSTFC